MLDIKTSAAADYLSRSATFSTNFSMLFGECPSTSTSSWS